MAVGSFTLTNQGKLNLLLDSTQTGGFDFEGNMYAVLLTNTHTPSVTTDSTLTDLTNECADGDYARQDMTGQAVTESTGTVKYDADAVSFGTTVSITARYIYLLSGTVAGATGTDKVMGYMDLNDGGTNVSSTNSTFEVDWDATNGILTI